MPTAMAPSAVDSGILFSAAPAKTYPPAKIYPVKEARFEKPIPPQTDGYHKAKSRPAGSAAIIIDNGAVPPNASTV